LNVTYGADIDFEKFEGNQSVYDIAKTMSSGGLINETQYRLGRYPTNHSQSYAGYVQAKYNIFQNYSLMQEYVTRISM
jgi:iron complex outermembrane receptor protein